MRNKILTIFATAFIGCIYYFVIVPLIGWDGLAIWIPTFGGMFALMFGVCAAFAAIAYKLVIKRAKNYATDLRAYGYTTVRIEDHEVRAWGWSLVTLLLASAVLFGILYLFYNGYIRAKEYGVEPDAQWWSLAIVLPSLIGAGWLCMAWSVVSTWYRSFYRLGRWHRKAKQGEMIEELPRLIP